MDVGIRVSGHPNSDVQFEGWRTRSEDMQLPPPTPSELGCPDTLILTQVGSHVGRPPTDPNQDPPGPPLPPYLVGGEGEPEWGGGGGRGNFSKKFGSPHPGEGANSDSLPQSP
jgi:hypothetical protein